MGGRTRMHGHALDGILRPARHEARDVAPAVAARLVRLHQRRLLASAPRRSADARAQVVVPALAALSNAGRHPHGHVQQAARSVQMNVKAESGASKSLSQ